VCVCFETNVVDLQFVVYPMGRYTSEGTEGWDVTGCSVWVRVEVSVRDVLCRRPFELQYQTNILCDCVLLFICRPNFVS
jgi:hypothetical protein